MAGCGGALRLGPTTRGDFIKPKNELANDMRDAVFRLKRLGEGSRKRDYRYERWF